MLSISFALLVTNTLVAFPADNPQVFELYWSRPQLLARGNPNLLKTHRFLMSYWHSSNPHVPLSTKHPISYADLNGADLNGADLNGAILWGAFLNGANLRGANLSRASLRETALRGFQWDNETKWGNATGLHEAVGVPSELAQQPAFQAAVSHAVPLQLSAPSIWNWKAVLTVLWVARPPAHSSIAGQGIIVQILRDY